VTSAPTQKLPCHSTHKGTYQLSPTIASFPSQILGPRTTVFHLAVQYLHIQLEETRTQPFSSSQFPHSIRYSPFQGRCPTPPPSSQPSKLSTDTPALIHPSLNLCISNSSFFQPSLPTPTPSLYPHPYLPSLISQPHIMHHLPISLLQPPSFAFPTPSDPLIHIPHYAVPPSTPAPSS